MGKRADLAKLDQELATRCTCEVCGKRWPVEILARDCEGQHQDKTG